MITKLEIWSIDVCRFSSEFAWTMMEIKRKTKDTFKSRQDLFHMDLKRDLHLRAEGVSHVMLMTCYQMTKDERRKFNNFFVLS